MNIQFAKKLKNKIVGMGKLRTNIVVLALLIIAMPLQAKKVKKTVADLWPDGTEIGQWFKEKDKIDIATLGKAYVITDYGVKQDSTLLQTEAIQAVIDKAAKDGGGVIVVPKGTFLSGALFFKQGTHLHLDEGGTIKGVDYIRWYPVKDSRMEGQNLKYFAALINAEGLNGFTITGKGTINGNGERFWREFWIRRQYNRQCTNLEAMRPRLVFIRDCNDVRIEDVHLINSAFWTCHLYKCNRVKILDTYFFAPHEPADAKAPSSDAIDIDVCEDVLVDGCYLSVNDDAIAIKGGKGTWADKDPNNGMNRNVLIQNCHYGFVHGCLTLGSESVHDYNIVLRNIEVEGASRVLWLKMRPDTPQHYEYVTVENIKGSAASVLVVRPWTQFFKPGDRTDMPLSTCNNIKLKNLDMKCRTFFDVGASDKYQLKDFIFEDLNIEASKDKSFDQSIINGCTVKNVEIK